MVMRTRTVPIANSQGIRIPEAMLEHFGDWDEAEWEW